MRAEKEPLCVCLLQRGCNQKMGIAGPLVLPFDVITRVFGGDVVATCMNAPHVPNKGSLVGEGFLALVTFRQFSTRVAEADVSEGNIHN